MCKANFADAKHGVIYQNIYLLLLTCFTWYKYPITKHYKKTNTFLTNKRSKKNIQQRILKNRNKNEVSLNK